MAEKYKIYPSARHIHRSHSHRWNPSRRVGLYVVQYLPNIIEFQIKATQVKEGLTTPFFPYFSSLHDSH